MLPFKSRRRILGGVAAAALAVGLVAASVAGVFAEPPRGRGDRGRQGAKVERMANRVEGGIPGGLEGGRAWINTGGDIRLEDLKGKVVLLDFWTLCCINCHHVLPELAALEAKYPNNLVVIGVHTGKFEAEKDTDAIRQKVREYRIKHPVVNDADQIIWNRFGINSWPSIVLIDPQGNYFGSATGEGNGKMLDKKIAGLIAKYRAKGELDETPVAFKPESERPRESPLHYPGKLLADPDKKRLFVSDTGNNRIVVTDFDGKVLHTIGSGAEGKADGSFDKASFNRPQGVCLLDGTLYVADTENHEIRAVDLKDEQVRTVAGTGEQWHPHGHKGAGPAKESPLTSPWDLAPSADGKSLYIAMAGYHQIWRLNLDKETVGVWAGTGREDVIDGDFRTACFAQPSGLATDGKHLFVADSEGSVIREINLGADPAVRTLVGAHDLPGGQSLFSFDDIDGPGPRARLQHCLGVAYHDGKVFIADTYNSKIKVCDLKTHTVSTLAGSPKGEAGDADSAAPARKKGDAKEDAGDDAPDQKPRKIQERGAKAKGGSEIKHALFDQPGGLSVAGSTLYVADTNNHKIRVVDIASGKVSTLKMGDLTTPKPPTGPPKFLNKLAIAVPAAKVPPGKSVTLDVHLALPEDLKLNPDTPMTYLVEAPRAPDFLSESISTKGERVQPPSKTFQITVPLAKEASAGDVLPLKVSLSTFQCRGGSEGYCKVQSYIWTVSLTFADDAKGKVTLTTPEAKAAK